MIDDKSDAGAWAEALKFKNVIERIPAMTDHAAATTEALEKILALLRAGHAPEDLGGAVILLGRLMARRT
jgi:hypothetical protein